MKAYCMQQGVLKTLTPDEVKQFEIYKINCLKQAEILLDAAKLNIEAARLLIKDSNKYD
jgi:hypothetical protein